jgi:glycerophosphoryl diester phosphodiesterase
MLDIRRAVTGKISIVGHRGAAGCAPENTLAAFREGLAQGADVIELDVQLTADGYVAALHDDTLERTTNGRGPAAQLTLAELKKLDAGSWFDPRFAGESIPTLDEVLEWARGRAPLFIELKPTLTPSPALGAAVVERLSAFRMMDQAMVIAFDHEALRRVREHTPRLTLGALLRELPDDPAAHARAIGANVLMPAWGMVTPGLVQACHAAGLGVSVWGAGADYAALIAAGVDAMNADHPAQVRREFL